MIVRMVELTWPSTMDIWIRRSRLTGMVHSRVTPWKIKWMQLLQMVAWAQQMLRLTQRGKVMLRMSWEGRWVKWAMAQEVLMKGGLRPNILLLIRQDLGSMRLTFLAVWAWNSRESFRLAKVRVRLQMQPDHPISTVCTAQIISWLALVSDQAPVKVTKRVFHIIIKDWTICPFQLSLADS